jgi:hypothetical protein
VSLVSAWGRNWHYLCGRIERVETGELVETANIHAVFMHVAENMVGWPKSQGEYPTLSAIVFSASGGIQHKMTGQPRPAFSIPERQS